MKLLLVYKLFFSVILLVSFILWMVLGYLTAFTNLLGGYNFFNYVHTISASIFTVTMTINLIRSKQSRDSAKKIITSMFKNQNKNSMVGKKDLPDLHCTKCKEKNKKKS